MPRRQRRGTGGIVFHVINRSARRARLFDDDSDYRALLECFAEAHRRVRVGVFAYCLMPNHFHLIVRPDEDGQLSEFMRLGTGSHSVRWHWKRGTQGGGCVYQGRYRAFPIQANRYFLNACGYVEANALRASMVRRAEDWAWSSLWASTRNCHILPLSEWPILQPSDWIERVNQRHSDDDLNAIHRSLSHNHPLGEPDWAKAVAASLGLSTRPPGRPKRESKVETEKRGRELF